MKPATPFHASQTPIESGFTVIEASAGTGKTYTIALLVVRLILERGLSIEQILVSTYTELATAELRERIRARLVETLSHFEQDAQVDEGLAAVCAKFQEDEQKQKAIRSLRDALVNFDRAAIYTIHGFCKRMLSECAFESGSLFNAELIEDERSLLRSVVNDFWRTQIYDNSPLISQLAAQHMSVDQLSALLNRLNSNPTIQIEGEKVGGESQTTKTEIVELWNELKSTWKSDEQTIRGYFSADGNAWAKNNIGKPERMAEFFDQLEAAFSEVGQIPDIKIITPDALEKATRAKHATPGYPFFKLCEDWISLTANFGTAMQFEFCEWALKSLRQRKEKRNVIAFSDMLMRLRDALSTPGDESFAALLRDRFRAALIDEFQDTDPIQYEIFWRIYRESDAPIFLIGDPKQAIYKFRGADVYTYLKAQKEADRIYTLETNWRSSGELVAGVNALFENSANPFVVNRIVYRAVKASGKANGQLCAQDGKEETRPLKLQLVLDTNDPAEKIEAQLCQMVAREIRSLLEDGSKIVGRTLLPRDFAVLVSSNKQAQQMQRTFSRKRIPSVLYSASSVFESREAAELECVLLAISEPRSEPFWKAALATEMLGFSPQQLVRTEENFGTWEKISEEFQRYHELWEQRGFISMFRELLHSREIRQRLLKFSDGERRLTNLLHLGELLQCAASGNSLTMTTLIQWLSAQRQGAGDSSGSDEHQLRLESDEDAVRVLTVHKSKGLEYGIVFCPFVWSNPWKNKNGNSYVEFHDENDALKLAISGATNEMRELEAHETLAEQMRQLYVAATRAKYRCDLFWGDFAKGQQSALTYLLGANGDEAALLARKNISAEQIRAEALAVSKKNRTLEICETIRDEVTPMPNQSILARKLEFHPFEGRIDASQGVTSFSSLTKNSEETVNDDFDEDESSAIPEEITLEGIAEFPRGATPGVALHQIFERIDFTKFSEIPAVVSERLRSFGIRGFDAMVSEMVERVVRSPLAKGVELSRVAMQDRLTELEFHFPISELHPQKLTAFFERQDVGGEWTRRLNFHAVSGFMKGFIDLVFEQDGKFYIADWKSNWLGARAADYHENAMRREMVRHLYWLQLHLYVVALHRFLKLRVAGYDYDSHVGGIFYIFLRGVAESQPGCGVIRHRPSRETIEELAALLGGQDGR